jgi:hypothetical protein
MGRNLYSESVKRFELPVHKALLEIAHYAARQVAIALLDEAREIGVTAEQYEALRAKAAEVAYD